MWNCRLLQIIGGALWVKHTVSDSFTILGLWVLGLVSNINELWVKNIIFNDKSAVLLHPGTRWNKNFASQGQNYAQKMQDAQVTKSLKVQSLYDGMLEVQRI